VVIENIYRQMELGLAKKEAAKVGATEVAMAITASTLTTIAVFFPMLFSEGMTGTLVRGLALTVAFALSASLFVALTIVPAFASTIFKNNNKERKETRFEKLKKRYLVVLGWALQNRKKTLILVASLFIASFGLLFVIGTEFMPSQDVPMMMLTLKMPKGTTLEETDTVVKQVEQIFMKTEGVRNVMGFSGAMSEGGSQADPSNPHDVNEAGVYVRLFEKSDRAIGYLEIEDIVRKQLPKIEGATFKFLSREEMMGGGASKPIEIKVYGRDLVKLKEIAGRIEERLLNTEKVKDVINSVKEGKPEVHIVVDKDKAFKYGLTSAQIASAIKTATIGTVAGVFRKSGEEIDIRVQLDAESRNSFDDIEHLSITSPMGFTVPLNQLAHIEHRIGETDISREQQMRKATISAGIDDKNLGKMVKIVKANIQDIEDELPTGYFVEFGGAYGDMLDAFKTLLGALILAMILVYIVMASQFESLKQPFIVMFTMPLAFIGVLLILFLTGTTLSVYSFVGIIILSGIVVNNGIVLVDHINQLRIKGFEKHKALLQAGADRMRPVIITALTTITGMLPMALDNSEGSEMKIPMALTVIGGLLTATFFTLIVIPVIYSVMDKKNK
jgi:HAE1 family hydrophobic/amphiphilic exporter-1